MMHHRLLVPHMPVGTGVIVVDVPPAEHDTCIACTRVDHSTEQAGFSQRFRGLVCARNTAAKWRTKSKVGGSRNKSDHLHSLTEPAGVRPVPVRPPSCGRRIG